LREYSKLLQSFRDGDFSSTDALGRQHEDMIYGLCRRLTGGGADADDLYQQTWLRAVRSAGTFADRSFKNWLITICINTYRDNYRRAQRRFLIEGAAVSAEEKEYMLLVTHGGSSAESQAMRRIEDKLLLEKVSSLPDKHRLPVILHYLQGLGYSECAQVLGIPEGTVKSRLSHARQKLKKAMERETDERY